LSASLYHFTEREQVFVFPGSFEVREMQILVEFLAIAEEHPRNEGFSNVNWSISVLSAGYDPALAIEQQ